MRRIYDSWTAQLAAMHPLELVAVVFAGLLMGGTLLSLYLPPIVAALKPLFGGP